MLKKDNKNNRVFCLLGDGECQEGSVYEAMTLARQLKLDNLYILIDYNKMQAMGFVDDIISLEPLEDRLNSFGLETFNIDGNDCLQIKNTILLCDKNDKPHAIICNTIKGKGISFMEMNLLWHYRYPHEGAEYDDAVAELNAQKPSTISDPYRKK